MVISTAIMIAGALAGGVGGGLANKKRRKDQQAELDILALKNQQNYQEQKAMAVGLKNSVENQTIQATQGARRDAIDAFQATSSLSAAAGASGVRGGTPFYKMGQVAADAAEAMNENARMRANQISSTRESGAAEMAGILTNGSIIDKQTGNAQDSMGYLSSPLGWAQSILTGAISGAEVGAKISAGLELAGVDTGADISSLFPKKDSPAEAASKAIGASGMGAAGVTPDMMGGAKETIDRAASGDGNLNDYIAKYKYRNKDKQSSPFSVPTFSVMGLGALFSRSETSMPDFGEKVDLGIMGLGTTQTIGNYEWSTLLTKNRVAPSFDVFSGVQF